MSHGLGSLCLGALAVAAALVTPPAWADSRGVQTATPDSPEAIYQRERAACLAGQSHQDRATCLKEAEAARDEARRGLLLQSEDVHSPEQRALRRCQALPPERRADCERMARGEGEVSGSVEAGGVLRQITTRTVETVETEPVPITPAQR